MNFLSFRYLSVLIITLFVIMPTINSDNANRPLEKDGTLVVLVTWGDVDNSPATNVYVEAYGFVRKYGTTKSFLLKSTGPGQYEASLSPGVYDVFVSEGTSTPRCRRVLITAGYTGTWTLKLEMDDVYQQRSSQTLPLKENKLKLRDIVNDFPVSKVQLIPKNLRISWTFGVNRNV